jgi:Domain of unknown function (DUF4331)
MAVPRSKTVWILGLLGLALAALLMLRGSGPEQAFGASHREAPLISLDPEADITDFFMFRSYETGRSGSVDLIMDVIPGEEPSSGPNYFNFDPNVVYAFNVDNNEDGIANDVRFEVRFQNEFRGTAAAAGLFLPYVAVPGPITALDGPGSEGLGFRQKYSVRAIWGGGLKSQTLASGLIAVPSNAGPRTMPNYDALAAQGIYSLDGGARVFAGQRDDPFAIDLGAIFDTLNLRAPGTDMLSGFNVHTIALEVPAGWLTADGLGANRPHPTTHPKLGAYAETERQVQTVRGVGSVTGQGDFVQVQRLANPLVNEAIIGTVDKDRWNSLEPTDEGQFLGYYQTPRLGIALKLVFGADPPATPRDDLVNLLLKYGPTDHGLSELLRLDLSVPPVPLAQQKPLTVLQGDNAGWPNGRRPLDDVTDIAIKVVGGPNYSGASDGVTLNDKPLPGAFPFISSPWDGRNRVHQNP